MAETLEVSKAEERKLEFLLKWFVNHTRYYAVETNDGWAFKNVPILPHDLLRHVRGTRTLGLYPLDLANSVKWVCWDIDTEDPAPVYALTGVLTPPYVVEHTGGRGRHVWQFFNAPTPAAQARAYADNILYLAGVEAEVYPKQDKRGDGVPGQSLIRLPFGVAQKTLRRSRKEWGEFGYTDLADELQSLDRASLVGVGLGNNERPNGVDYPDYVKDIWEGRVKDGNRNVTLNRYIYSMARRGFPPDLVETIAVRANECLDPPLDDREMELLLRDRRM